MEFTIISFISREIEQQQKEILNAEQKLSENYCYNFEWNYPEHLYKSYYTKKFMEDLRKDIDNDKDRCEEFIDFEIERITNEILKGEVRRNSTSQFSNLAHTLRIECDAYILKQLKDYKYHIKKGVPVSVTIQSTTNE